MSAFGIPLIGVIGYRIAMLEASQNLPEKAADLRVLLASREVEIIGFKAELRSRDFLIEKLKHQLAGLRRHQFGSRSESLDQLELTLEEEEIARAAEAPAPQPSSDDAEEKRQPKRRPLPDHLPRDETVLEVGDACASCGGKLKRLGEDVTEELEYVPGRFVVNRIVRPRMACACCERITQAALPSRPIERGRPGSGLLAHVLVNKYADHLPLYRQSQIFAREGIDLGRSTLTDWVGSSTALLEPLADAIGRHVLRGDAIFADDTPVKVLTPGAGKTKTARLWAYARDERPWAGDARPPRVSAGDDAALVACVVCGLRGVRGTCAHGAYPPTDVHKARLRHCRRAEEARGRKRDHSGSQNPADAACGAIGLRSGDRG